MEEVGAHPLTDFSHARGGGDVRRSCASQERSGIERVEWVQARFVYTDRRTPIHPPQARGGGSGGARQGSRWRWARAHPTVVEANTFLTLTL